jgi:hypothetical protein
VTPDQRRRALLTVLGAKLAIEAADQQIKRSCIGYGRISFPTVAKVLRGDNCKVSSLIEIADSLNMDIEITLRKRSA